MKNWSTVRDEGKTMKGRKIELLMLEEQINDLEKNLNY